MSKEGSVAPKERVNITYKPAVGNAKEEVELPLKLLMVGDYTMRPDPRPLGPGGCRAGRRGQCPVRRRG